MADKAKVDRGKWKMESGRRLLFLLSTFHFLLCLPGCNIVAPAAYIIQGPPKTPAVVELEDKTTVVYVDDRRNVLPRSALRQIMAEKAGEVLMTKKIITTTISPRDAMAIARQESNSEPLSMAAIAQRVEADQIIYVEMDSFSLTPDGYTPRPQATCAVWVLDVANRRRILPAMNSLDRGYLLTIDLGATSMDGYSSEASLRKLEETLASFAGVKLAQMFFEHEELGQRLGRSQ